MRFPIAFAACQIDIEHMDFVVARDDLAWDRSGTNGSRPFPAEPRWQASRHEREAEFVRRCEGSSEGCLLLRTIAANRLSRLRSRMLSSPGCARSPRRPLGLRISAARRHRGCAPADARSRIAGPTRKLGLCAVMWRSARQRKSSLPDPSSGQTRRAADVGRADENLRHCPAAMRALNHFGPSRRVAHDIDLGKADAFPGKQFLCREAIGAERRGVDFDGHFGPEFGQPRYMIRAHGAPGQPWQKPGHRRSRAPARSKIRAQVSRVAPSVRTSSTSSRRLPRTCGRASPRHPEGALDIGGHARSCVSPTCWRVARIRLSRSWATGTPLMRETVCARVAAWVETARPQPAPMQGHWNERIGLAQELAPGGGHPASHGGCEVEPVAIFERLDQGPRRLINIARPRVPGCSSGGWRSLPWTTRPAPGHRQTECPGARNKVAK